MRSFALLLSAILPLVVAPSALAQLNAALGKPVTTQYSTSTLNSTYPGDYGPAKITDGDLASFSHPNTMTTTLGFRYDINLGRSYALDRLRIYNRNNCCPERLSNYRVSILTDNGAGVPVTPPVWTAVVRANGTNSGQGGFDEVLASAHAVGTFTGQWVRIENISGSAYNPQIAEVQALSFDAGNSPNIALLKPVTSSGATWSGLPSTNLTDGSLTTLSHPLAEAGASLGFYYQVDFLSDYVLDRAVLFQRADGCCPERLTRYQVALYADNGGVPGAQTWMGEFHMDGTYLGSGEGETIRAEMGTGDFHGRFLRVTNLSNEGYNPQLSEIEAYKPPVPVIKFFTTDTGNITATGASGMASSAQLSWSVQGATSLSINQGIGSVTAPAGSVAVTPPGLTTYTLTAANTTGSATATVVIAVDAVQVPPRINEIMAENDGALDDEDGDQPDWVELYNPNAFTAGLAGAHLSDAAALPSKWTFPAGASIPPGGYLVVFASNKDRAITGSPLHTNFELRKAGEAVFLSSPAGSLWSQLPGDYPATAAYPAQFRDTSYGIDGAGNERFFRPATPHAVNAAAGFTAVVEDTSFSVKRGFYSSAQSVAITTLTPGAEIRYTLDGTKPTASTGTLYTGPINVTSTTVIRAAAFLAGAAPSNVDTHTYVFASSVASQPSMLTTITGNATWGPQIPAGLTDVPTISLVTPNATAFNNDTEIETNFEYLNPADPLQHTHANSGATYFGGAFTNFPKKSFRLYFRGRYGDKKLKAPLFAGHEHGAGAVDEFEGIELRSGSHDMNQRGFYMSNLFTDQVLSEMGHLAPHGRFVHLYLNGTYWGLYHLRERWNADMHASYLGGKAEDYEAINGNYNVGGWATPGQPFDGDGSAWEYAKSRRTSYNELRSLIDVPNYTDYMITWMFGNSEDEWRGVSPARLIGPGSGSRFILNDADGWLSVNNLNAIAVWDGNDNNTARASTWNGTLFTAGRTAGDGPGSLFAAMYLTAGADFRSLLADRIHRALFNNGPLTPAANAARLNAMCTPIERAFIAESARWNNRTPSNWTGARDVCLNSWIPGRTATVLTQFRNAGLYPTLNAPVFSQNGGTFPAGFNLSLSVTGAPVGSVIYYTVDGSDPRMPGGSADPASLIYSSPVTLLRNTVVKARTRDSAGNWSALQEGFFQLNTSSPVPAGLLLPSEINYDDEDAEFIELMNVSRDTAINLRGCRFTAGISFAFSEFRDTILAPGQRIVLVDSEFKHRARYGWDRTIGGIYFDNLANSGEVLTFVCGATTAFSFAYSDAWAPLIDGGTRSLTLIRPRVGLDPADASNWRRSGAVDGTPGAGDSGPAFTGDPATDGDNDGASRLLEYAMGTSDADTADVPAIAFVPGVDSSFSFTRAFAADDAVIIPEISTDMTTWSSGSTVLVPFDDQTQPDGKIRSTYAPVPGLLAGASRYYARVRVVPRF